MSEETGKPGAVRGDKLQSQPLKSDKVVKLDGRKKSTQKSDKPDRSQTIRNYFNAIMRSNPLSNWPEFPHRIFVFEDPLGNRLPTSIGESDVLSVLTEQAVTNLILQYSEVILLAYGPAMELRIHEAKEITSRWLANAKVIKHSQIAPVRFKSDEGYTWHRLDFDPLEGACPTFDEMFSRMDNPDTVQAWIGSLFVKEASRQNYLWLHGSGGQGKSSLSKFLSQLFGKSYRSEMVPDQSSKRFWTSGLVGSRLVVFPDCNESFFVTTSLFKSLTGDDDIRIEYKNQHPMSIKLDCKFMFISNERPNISGSRADTRRIVYSEILPLTKETKLIPTNQYRALLYAERAEFINKCLQKYYQIFPNHSDLSPENAAANESLQALISDNEEYLAEVFHEYFVIKDNYDQSLPETKKPHVTGLQVMQLTKALKWKRGTINKFYEYMERQSDKVYRVRTKKSRIVVGIIPKTRDNFRNERDDY